MREADGDTVVLADGFSCRTQIHQLDSDGREGIHLAELLATAFDDGAPTRPAPPRPVTRAALLSTLLVGGAALGIAVSRRATRRSAP